MTRLSLRTRLLLITISVLWTGLAVSDSIVVFALHGHLVKRVDAQITTAAAVLSILPVAQLGPSRTGTAPLGTGTGLDLIDHGYIAYLAPDGTVETSAAWPANGRADQPDLSRMDTASAAATGGDPFDVAANDGSGRWRVVVLPSRAVTLPEGTLPPPAAERLAGTSRPAPLTPGGSIVVAASLDQVDAAVARQTAIWVAVGVLLLVLLAAGAWWSVRAALRPLRRIESVATGIAAGDLSIRVPLLAAPDTEIGRLSTALNAMLAQLERAFAARDEAAARTRRFVADVSHELRTPLFGIKGFAELYRMGGLPERSDVDRTMARIDSEAGRLARLAEDLLLLARLDEAAGDRPLGGRPVQGRPPGDRPLHLAPMDLRTLAADARHDLHALDPSRTITLTAPAADPDDARGVSPAAAPDDARGVSPAVAPVEATAGAQVDARVGGDPRTLGPPGQATVLADEARLRQVTANLVGNVVAHTSAGTPVRIGVGTVGDQAILEIADTGPGLDAEQAERVFERFYRVDRSRSRGDGGGAGLGLAIVTSVVEAHGGWVELCTAKGRGSTFRIVLSAGQAPDER